MLSHGLVLAALLSASPDPSTEAPIVVVSPAPAPTPAPAPVVVVPSKPAPLVIPATVHPAAPPRKPNAGGGLMAAASVVFAVGMGAQITGAVAQANYCQTWSDRGFNGVHGCFYETEPWSQHMGTGFAFGSALVMSSIGAGALGQHHAWQAVYGDRRQRNPRSRVAAGALFTALGVGAFVAEGFLLRRELSDFCTTHECEVQRRALYYGLGDGGSLSLIAGISMLSYGHNYATNRARYGKRWSLAPQASRTMLGASATVRF